MSRRGSGRSRRLKSKRLTECHHRDASVGAVTINFIWQIRWDSGYTISRSKILRGAGWDTRLMVVVTLIVLRATRIVAFTNPVETI